MQEWLNGNHHTCRHWTENFIALIAGSDLSDPFKLTLKDWPGGDNSTTAQQFSPDMLEKYRQPINPATVDYFGTEREVPLNLSLLSGGPCISE